MFVENENMEFGVENSDNRKIVTDNYLNRT